MRPTLNSLALAKRAVSLFSSRAAALVSRVSRLRCSRARALLSVNLKKKRDCSQSIVFYLFYPSPKPTLSVSSPLGQNVGLGEGRWSVSQKPKVTFRVIISVSVGSKLLNSIL